MEKGYLIPKGAMIIPLFIAMRNNKALFDKPAEFTPSADYASNPRRGILAIADECVQVAILHAVLLL